MEALLSLQDDFSSRIFRARINFKKSPKERITKDYVNLRLESLEQLWSEFKKGHKNLLQQCDSQLLKMEEYITADKYTETEEEFMAYKCELKRHLPDLSTTNDDEGHGSNSNIKSHLVKLPKVNIPIFSGKYTEWITFRDLFVSMIHNNTSLDNVQRLQYLKGFLSGEAEQLIRYIPVSDANYKECWKMLQERYNNKKYLSHCILKRFLSQKNATSESATFLRELIDTSTDCLNALSNLDIDVSTWDIMVIHLLSNKLDSESRKQWELNVTMNVPSDSLPTFSQFKDFLTGRYRALEFMEPRHVNKQFAHSKPNVSNPKVLHTISKLTCELCGEEHKLSFCKKFGSLDHESRREFVTKNRICFNCLGSNHGVKFCQTPISCKICKKRHHSLLHPRGVPSSTVNLGGSDQAVAEVSGKDNGTSNRSQGLNMTSTVAASHMACSDKIKESSQVLLATALVEAESRVGQCQVIRALLDQGSQASFVTEATVQGLGLKRIPASSVISGLGGDKTTMVSKYMVSLKIKSRVEPGFTLEVKAYVLNNITTYLPGKRIVFRNWDELKHLCLADPAYGVPKIIDILLGAEVYSQILKEGLLRGPIGCPVAQCTALGWILSGPVCSDTGKERVTVMHSQVEFDIKRFWELESEPLLSSKMLTAEEQRCEDIYAATTCRNEDGRYVVKLPFRDEDPPCKNGDSREIAIKRFKNLEKRFSNDSLLKEKYTEVIREYLSLNHMVLVREPDNDRNQSVYLPHHAVIREDKSTSKVRVVFDASCKNKNGVSLNDTLMIGPTLQPDLRHVILNWRTYPVCIIADIVKMYRMVRVAEKDCDFQRIVWRDKPEDAIQDYKLRTVTFGTAPAPYLAVKTLNQVAIDYKEKYPVAAAKVEKEFYMDDLLTGCQNLKEGEQLVKEMDALLRVLREGGFILQKWSTNRQELVPVMNQNLKQENNRIEEKENKELEIKIDNTMKILGLTWNRSRDEFQYSVKLPPLSAPVTKRKIISDISRLYDPLGWIAPCVIKAKIFIQRLWIAGTGWDEEPTEDILKDWYTYRSELTHLTEFRLERWLNTNLEDVIELHGFSDASHSAYAAVVYLRVINASGAVHVGLVASKTRVAPVKQVSIPRLELCGAVLLVKLLTEVAEVLNIPKSNVRAWTDSTVVLAWINKHASNWKTFVANRVAEIQTTLESSHWSHVSTKDNPADCASRGVQPVDFCHDHLWKFGPKFLWEKTISYTRLSKNETHEEEQLRVHVGTVDDSILDKYSSLNKLIRVVAYCRRFGAKRNVSSNRRGYLTTSELDEALTTCIRLAQRVAFQQEIQELLQHGQVKSKQSKLLSLTPYLDDRKVLRVGGRISKSQETENVKHPIILPDKSVFSKLIVDDAHRKTLHGDVTLMLNYLRSAYWIIGAKNLVKQHVRKCVICVRHKAKLQTQLMGSLPSVRVTPTRVFVNSGVDFAGPIMLRTTKGRGHKAYKGYICLFICMVTKAIHIEVASDLTSRGFIEAFKRFVARRGCCLNLYSDNGTNFVGAAKELRDLFDAEKSSVAKEIADSLATQGTAWHFIPPRSPNFGGLWESGIKSTKYHIKRVIGESTLTYEEMATLLTQIEACLNSRPLTMVSNDPEEASPLTPGHFLIGEPIVTVPEVNYETCKMSSLKRWQLTQAMLQHFWRRWSNEYLTHLMHRYKWAHKVPEANVGDIVLVKEEDLPPSKLLFGKILKKHVGFDGLTRVVSLKVKNSIIKRPTSKLVVLPVCD